MTLITVAANNPDVGGGEVMLLAISEALRDLGHEVRVVAPAGDSTTIGAAAARAGFPTTAIRAASRPEYMENLRRWDAQEREGVLWCNGHVPAIATTGHADRFVHLHQAPTEKHIVAGRVAGMGTRAVIVPSASMAKRFPGAQILPNWVPEIASCRHERAEGDPITLGFIGRPSSEKGVVVLAQALRQLDATEPGRYRLLIAGEPRFVPVEDQRRVEAALAPVAHLVERPGWMERSEFFSRIDLAVFPSTCAEPFGLIVAEAMSARVPYVISNAGALPEVAGRRYPWIARAGAADLLASMIRVALTAPDAEREEVVEAEHARWQERFSPEAGRRHLDFLLTDILPAGALR